MVEKVHNEDEVAALLRLSQRHRVPVTFRAAGTSLSGQAVTDSILIKVCACVRGAGRERCAAVQVPMCTL